MTATTDLAVSGVAGHQARLLRAGHRRLRRLPRAGRIPTVRRCRRPARTRSTCPVCSGAAARRSRWRSSCETVRDNGRRAAARWSSPTAKRANPRRSRTAGCCGTGHISCSTGSGSRRRWCRPQRAHVYVSDRSAADAVQTALAEIDARRARRAVDQRADGRSRLRRRRGDRCGARAQRRTGQADRQAASPVRRRRRPVFRPWSAMSRRSLDSRSSRSTAPRRSANRARPRRRGRSSRRSPAAAGRPRSTRLPHGLAFTESARIPRCASRSGARRADGRLLRRSAEPRRPRRHTRPRVAAPARQRPGLRRGHDPHRRLPGGRCGVGDGLLRPGERGPVRLVLQRHRRDVGGHGGAARRRRRPTRTWPDWSDGRWCCAAAAPARRWTPRRTSPPACCRQFPQVVERHLDNDCDSCRGRRL